MNQEPTYDSQLSTADLQTDLKQRSIRGSFISVGARGVNTLVQIGSTVVLARLLTPSDFGLVAMVLVGLDLLMNFRDAGLSVATVQRAEINQAQVSTLFWINAAVGIALMLTMMIILAPTFAWFYNEPRLRTATVTIAVVFLFDGLAAQHRALLQRRMRFLALASVQVTSQVVSKAVAITMALFGLGYWALIAMPIAVSVCRAFMVWPLTGWFPGLPRKAKGIRSMISFGLNLTCTQLISFFSTQLDNILIGRFCGAFSLGLYSRAYNLVSMPTRLINWPMTSVLIPSLSILQDRPEHYRRFLRRALEKITFFAQPLAILMLVAAEELILTLLGNQWTEAVPIFRLLGIWGFLLVTQSGSFWVLISLDQTNRLVRWQGIMSSVHCLSIVLGLHWGALGVATAISISSVMLKLPELLYCYRKTPVTLRDFWYAVWRSTVASIGAGCLTFFLRQTILIGISNTQLRLSIISAIFGILYLGIFAMLPRGPEKLKDIMEKVRGLRGGKEETRISS